MPYAYGAKIRHEFETDYLNIWLTFRHPMQRSEIPQAEPPVYDWMPPLNLWLLKADEVSVDIVDSEWQDQFTILLTSDTIAAEPNRVLLAYDGPNSHLQTTWGKDWEPWGPILSTDIVKFPCFVDRGDPAAYDFDANDFIKDGNWHDVDVSGIVPEKARAILITGFIHADVANAWAQFRKDGNVNDKNIANWRTLVANQTHVADCIIGINDDRILEYRAKNVNWALLNFLIKGWLF